MTKRAGYALDKKNKQTNKEKNVLEQFSNGHVSHERTQIIIKQDVSVR